MLQTMLSRFNLFIWCPLTLLFLFLITPSKALAFQCIEVDSVVYLTCENESCIGIIEYLPLCSWVQETIDLNEKHTIPVVSGLKNHQNTDDIKGLWRVRVDSDCSYEIYQLATADKTLDERESRCSQKHISYAARLDEGSSSFSELRSEAFLNDEKDRAKRNRRVLGQFIFFIGLGPAIFLGLIIKLIMTNRHKLLWSIGFWIVIQLVIFAYLVWQGPFFWYNEGLDAILTSMVVLFSLGLVLLIGYGINRWVRHMGANA